MKTKMLKCALAAVAGLALAAPAGAQTVTIASGKIAGSAAGGVESWKGIPFAAPPVGDLRWRAPQPVAPWKGVRPATQYGPDCMQVPFPSDAAPLGTAPAEDCLSVNVWRPAGTTARAKLPVIFWIYGGGFVNGGASPPIYSGENLVKQGVLFVNFNYRVGRFGTFAHPQLTKANADGGLLGNYGHMDQLAALKWVQQNIASFGGDPANVTLIGESAGGMSVNTLVTSPMTQGLFARAIVMSGGNGQGMGPGGLAATETVGIDFAAKNGIAADDPQALVKLRALSADQVTDGLNMMALFMPSQGPRTFASPFPDGKLALDAAQVYRAGTFPKVPIMVGATDNDIGGPTGFMVAGAREVATATAAAGAPTWHYRFSYVAQSLNKTGADHAAEIPWFFDTVAIKYGDKTTPRDLAVGKAVSGYIVNFAKTGDPNGAGLPNWPRYSRAADTLMEFEASGQAVAKKDPFAATIDAATPPSR